MTFLLVDPNALLCAKNLLCSSPCYRLYVWRLRSCLLSTARQTSLSLRNLYSEGQRKYHHSQRRFANDHIVPCRVDVLCIGFYSMSICVLPFWDSCVYLFGFKSGHECCWSGISHPGKSAKWMEISTGRAQVLGLPTVYSEFRCLLKVVFRFVPERSQCSLAVRHLVPTNVPRRL